MSHPAAQPDTFTVEEAAAMLRLGRTAAYAAARRGDLPAIRIGRTLRVPRHRLEALLGIAPENESRPLGEADATKLGDDGADNEHFTAR